MNFDLREDYGMYTREGNAAIADIVAWATCGEYSWKETYYALVELARREGFEEALDTEVREAVYDAIGAADRCESFYV